MARVLVAQWTEWQLPKLQAAGSTPAEDTHQEERTAVEIPLKRKYTEPKTASRYKGGEKPDRRGHRKRRKNGPKTYVYGSRVRLVKPNGGTVMVDGNPS